MAFLEEEVRDVMVTRIALTSWMPWFDDEVGDDARDGIHHYASQVPAYPIPTPGRAA